jgi:hypothetical protein
MSVTPEVPFWTLLAQACDALAAAERWWLSQPEMDDRALFAWHETVQVRSGLERLLDRDDPPLVRPIEARQALPDAVACLARAAALTGPATAGRLDGYQQRLRRLIERCGR